MLGMSGLTLAKITSSLMVVSSDGQKSNLGLSLKFEARGMKVLDYSRKQGRSWEFSDKAVELIKEYRVQSRSILAMIATNRFFRDRTHFPSSSAALILVKMV
jgi:5'-3' exoribonuclease 1